MNSGNSYLNTLLEGLKKLLRTETVVGEPLNVGNITLIPLITVTLTIGGSERAGNAKRSCSNSNYGGVGCKISPYAILVIKNDGVSVLPLAVSTEKIVEMLPEIITGMDYHD